LGSGSVPFFTGRVRFGSWQTWVMVNAGFVSFPFSINFVIDAATFVTKVRSQNKSTSAVKADFTVK